MALLVGQKEEGNAVSAVGITKPVGFRFIAGAPGTDEAIELHIRSGSTATAIRVAIAADGGTVPGALLAGTNETEHACTASEETITITGLAVSGITAGTAYWLIVTPVSGTLKLKRSTSAEGESHRSAISTKVGTVISAVSEWTAEQTGPMFIAGTGTEEGATSPAILNLAAAASSSAATLATNAPTQVPLVAGASASAGVLAVTAPTQIVLSAATSQSTASLAITARTQIPLAAGNSTSAGTLSITAATQLTLAAAASSSSATLTVTVPGTSASLNLSPAASESKATAALTAATQLALSAASGSSNAGLPLTARALLVLEAHSESTATLTLSTKVLLPFAAAQSTSSGLLTVTIATATTPQATPTRINGVASATRITYRLTTRISGTANTTRVGAHG